MSLFSDQISLTTLLQVVSTFLSALIGAAVIGLYAEYSHKKNFGDFWGTFWRTAPLVLLSCIASSFSTNHLQVPADTDMAQLAGCYEQRIPELGERNRSVLIIQPDPDGHSIEGRAYDNNGDIAAEWRGTLIDLHPKDGQVRWVAEGTIWTPTGSTQVRNSGTLFVYIASQTEFAPAGSFTDEGDTEVNRYSYDMRRLEMCPAELA